MAALETVDDQLALCGQALADAIEQQAATAEILRAISRSPADAQPVFEMIAAAALRLCRARSANVLRYDGTLLHVAALASAAAQGVATIRSAYPRPADRGTTVGRAVITGGVVVIPDVLADPEYRVGHAAVSSGFRSVVGVPLLREGRPIGAIAVGRAEPGPFPASQVDLLCAFAEQAVIAIENTRLFNEREARNRELAEALEHQTATAEILRVLSQIPNDVQPVFEAIVNTGVRLFKGAAVAISRHHEGQVRSVAIAEDDPVRAARWRKVFPFPLSREYIHGAAILDCRVVDVADVLVVGGQFEAGKRSLAPSGYRAMTVVPLVRDGVAIGAIAVARMTPGVLSDKQIALLQSFADQAVIAIENVRLFNEREARNRELSEALEQQTATSDILRVISESPTDVQPVLDAVAERAAALCDARHASVFLLEDDMLWPRARKGEPGDDAGPVDGVPLKRSLLNARAFLDRRPVHVADILPLLDTEYPDARDNQRRFGFRAAVAVPMIREERAIGTIFAWRREARAFAATEIALLQTFADQAVIAIENVRLFKELQARTAQLTQSVEQLRALSEVGQAVGSTLDLATVLRTIVARATELTAMDGGAIYEYDAAAETFTLHTTHRLPAPLGEALAAAPMGKGEGAIGRLAITCRPVAVADILDAGVYQSHVRDILLDLGFRSLLAVPLLYEGRLLGGLVVNRKQAGAFEPRVVELLQTFATQSALAIQNARLFREIEEKSRQLEVASRHKSAFLAHMSHELRTPLNAIIGFTRIVMRRTREQIEAKQWQNLENILGSAQHLLTLINATLDLSRIEAGRIEIDATDVALAPLLEDCVRTIEPLLADGVSLETHVAGDLPTMRVDEEKLRQIVINLLSNAVKFTARGRIELRAASRGGLSEITIADTGIGIPADKLEAVFEEFEQVDASSTRAHGGTGLGLAIARRLARAMGGELHARSELGVGSSFKLILPLNCADDDT